jgi:hypothetical protein
MMMIMMMIGNTDTAPAMKTRVTKLMVSEETWSGAKLFSDNQEM